MNTKQIELLNRLREIIDRYIDDPEIRRALKSDVEPSKVKGVLAGIAEHTEGRTFTPDDEEAVKEIYCNFC